MNKLYVITGPAGVGKSTISREIAESLEKSCIIEGDDIYHFVSGGYVSPWKEGNHLDLMWENTIDILNNCLEKGYDVVFNYIINKDKLELLIENFKSYEMKFVVLMVDEETIVKRDKLRPEDCQMGERSIVLLNSTKAQHFDDNYILDTSNLNVEETVKIIINEDRFLVR